MGRLSMFGQSFRAKYNYCGKLTKECMSKDLWNEYCKMKYKERTNSQEYIEAKAERKAKRRQEKLRKQSDPLWKKKQLISKYLKYTNDIENVENFETALSENFKGWDIHHRKQNEGFKMSELIKANLYYHRPADELIFLRSEDHHRLHTCKNAELAYERALKKIERAQNIIKSAEKTIEYCKKILEENA